MNGLRKKTYFNNRRETMKKTSTEIKEILFNELDALRKGKSTPQKARAVSALVNSVIATTRIEMDFARMALENGTKPKALEMT